MATILDKIEKTKRSEIAAAKSKIALDEIMVLAKDAPHPRGFLDALKQKTSKSETALIAEIKKASPSKGLIREHFIASELAEAYASGGATCLSVLTDGPHFQGSMDDMIAARDACALPVLRKDFMYEPYQVYEARANGADCILVILAALSDDHARAIETAALELGMDVLLEVHNQEELDRALKLESRFLGINNRNLKTFETSLSVSEALAPSVPDGYHLVGESGIYTPDDIARLQRLGINTFLVGESLMRQPNVEVATRTLLSLTAGEPARLRLVQ